MGVVVEELQRLKDDNGQDIVLHVADDVKLTFTIKDGDGIFIDISGFTIKFRLNSDADTGNSDNKIFEVTGSFTSDGTDGKVDITLTSTELPATAEGYDRHFYIIDTSGGVQRVLTHHLLNVFPNPIAA